MSGASPRWSGHPYPPSYLLPVSPVDATTYIATRCIMTRPSGSRGTTPDQLAPEGVVVADLFSTVMGRVSGKG